MEEKKINRDKSLQTVAKVFLILTSVLLVLAVIIALLISISTGGIYIWLTGFIPLIWCIPMTVHYCNKINNNEDVSIAFKICAFIFVSPIAGTAMIADGVTKNLYDAIQSNKTKNQDTIL